MPYYQRKKAYRRNSRRYTRRRSYRNRRSAYNRRPSSRMTVYKNVTSRSAFPPVYCCKMTYSEGPTNLTTTLDVPDGDAFMINSVYDPDIAAGGTQPQYFDSLFGPRTGTAPYSEYVVTGAKITATFTSRIQTEIAENPGVAIWVDPSGTSFDSGIAFKDVMEMPWSRTAIIGRNVTSANPTVKLSMYVPIDKLFGVRRSTLIDSNIFRGTYNTNPGQQAICNVAVYNTSTTVVGQSSVDYFIKIVYYVRALRLNGVAARD